MIGIEKYVSIHLEIPEQCQRKRFLLINKMANDVIPPKNGVTSLQRSSSYLKNLCVSDLLPFYLQFALICCDLCGSHSPLLLSFDLVCEHL